MVTIPDEVWDRLDPAAGRLRGRAWLKVGLAVLALVAGYLATWLVWQSGLVVSRLRWSAEGALSQPSAPELVRVPLTVWNPDGAPVTVLAIEWSAPGMHAVPGDAGQFPFDVSGDWPVEIVLTYRIDDCAAIPRDVIPLRAVVQRLGNTSTVDLPPNGEQRPWHLAVPFARCR